MPAKKASGRLSSNANHTGGREPSGKTSFSAKLVKGTMQRLSTPSHRRQWDDLTLRMLVTPESVFLPVMAKAGEGMPQRAMASSRTPPYALIEATYLVLAESRLSAISDVDAPGIRVGAPARTAYGLWLESNLVRATLVLADGIAAAGNLLARREIDALAGSGLGSSPTAPTFPVASCCPAGSPRSRKRSATARSIGKSRIFSALSSKRPKPPASSLA